MTLTNERTVVRCVVTTAVAILALSACASARANPVVSASVAGLSAADVLAAAEEVCVENSGAPLSHRARSITCSLGGRKVAFSLSGGEPAMALDVVSLDTRTSEHDLRGLRDDVLLLLSR